MKEIKEIFVFEYIQVVSLVGKVDNMIQKLILSCLGFFS